MLIISPYERIPIFVKEGAIIPFGPEIQYSTEKPAETITLYVYGGKDGKFELYEDENTNYNYENGKFLRIPISYNEATKKLSFGRQEGEGFEGMLKKRIFNVMYINKNKAKALNFEARPDKVISYTGKAQSVRL